MMAHCLFDSRIWFEVLKADAAAFLFAFDWDILELLIWKSHLKLLHNFGEYYLLNLSSLFNLSLYTPKVTSSAYYTLKPKDYDANAEHEWQKDNSKDRKHKYKGVIGRHTAWALTYEIKLVRVTRGDVVRVTALVTRYIPYLVAWAPTLLTSVSQRQERLVVTRD